MTDAPGKLLFIVLAAVALAAAGAWLIAWRYRAAMRRLMREPGAASAAVAPPSQEPTPRGVGVAPAEAATRSTCSAARSRRAAWRVTAFVVGVSFAIACSSAAIWLAVVDGGRNLTFGRWWMFTLLHGWPVVVLLALLWRWSAARWLAGAAAYLLLTAGVVWWRLDGGSTAQIAPLLLLEMVLPSLLLAVLLLGAATRAMAPALLLPAMGLVAASIVGLDVLGLLVKQRVTWLAALPVDPTVVLIAFAVLPWLIAIWPLRALGRWLARAYAEQRYSELTAQMTVVWAVVLAWHALGVSIGIGWTALVMFLPLLWIPAALQILRRFIDTASRPPLLLVLRVFRNDAAVQRLFDGVVGRWRLCGNTVLIAGTDLVERTIDSDDVLTFLDGRLAERFISTPADVGARIAELRLRPDDDGRHRINECYCRDSTWRDAFAALVDSSERVLMDLRGFQAANAGCRHELESLALSRRELRVVVVVDDATDREAAAQAVVAAPPGRFEWVDAGAGGRLDPRRLLDRLFAEPPPKMAA